MLKVEKRYTKNIGTLTCEGQERIFQTTVAVVGAGGIGGFVIEGLARLGVKEIVAVDKDVFDETNLNRQVLSTVNNLGSPKVIEAEKRVKEINPRVRFQPVSQKACLENLPDFLGRADYIFDATDNIEIRKELSKFVQDTDKVLIHGGCAGWYVQVAVITKHTPSIERLFRDAGDQGAEKVLGNPVFAPMLTAALELSEFCKLVSGKGKPLAGKCLVVNLLTNEYRVFEF
jgi:molybdopterin/thiamine biosynthesis adenylyltransferase